MYRMSFCACAVSRRNLQYQTSAMARSVSCVYLQRIVCLALTVVCVTRYEVSSCIELDAA